MSEKAPEGVIVCVCGNRSFYAIPDGADSWIVECPACGWKGAIASGPGVTLSFSEVRDPVDEDVPPR